MILEWDGTLILIIISLGFLAAFIDAVVGGGGFNIDPRITCHWYATRCCIRDE